MWKPNRKQRADYVSKCRERNDLSVIRPKGAIRNGCKVTFYSFAKGKVISGVVIKNSYGVKTNQHSFTILTNEHEKVRVMGRNLYPNLIEHIQGEESLIINSKQLFQVK